MAENKKTAAFEIEKFAQALRCRAEQVEARLQDALSPSAQAGQTPWPPRLLAAMRHGVFNGGKRLRPFLVLESAALLAADDPAVREKQMRAALECAAALEAVHCYSLIHDDLPAMDNDNWRRGKPTVHKAYDEATALLAGSALFTLAFQILNAPQMAEFIAPAQASELSFRLAEAAGAGGMIGGQMLDMQAEQQVCSADDIIALEKMKTGALLRFACAAGAALTDADNETCALMDRFGAVIGFTFQLADDILDSTAGQAALGKTPGKDAAAGKATLVALYGMDKARALLREKTDEAQNMLAPFGAKAEILRQAAEFIACRNH